ncbi:MAG: YkgJ family cysteine cluster protein [Candidatus Thorarchaeota archaeon]|jgi:hypothetical protein
MPKSCKCPECIECCERRPGLFIPGEARKLARHMKLSLQELFNKYLVVDFYAGDPDGGEYDEILCLTPCNVNSTPGTKLSFADRFRSYDRCIFLTDNEECSIHKFKPYECKYTLGCSSEREKPTSFADIARRWKTKTGKKEIKTVWKED